jgi:hypothetical protein
MNRDLATLRRELAELQGNRCGICGASDRTGTHDLDHDHDSGMVRGFLCRGCNLLEGRHGICAAPMECEVCTWRIRPAVSWIGWTVAHQPTAGVAAEYVALRPWTTTEAQVEQRQAFNRRMGEAMARTLDGMFS